MILLPSRNTAMTRFSASTETVRFSLPATIKRIPGVVTCRRTRMMPAISDQPPTIPASGRSLTRRPEVTAFPNVAALRLRSARSAPAVVPCPPASARRTRTRVIPAVMADAPETPPAIDRSATSFAPATLRPTVVPARARVELKRRRSTASTSMYYRSHQPISSSYDRPVVALAGNHAYSVSAEFGPRTIGGKQLTLRPAQVACAAVRPG